MTQISKVCPICSKLNIPNAKRCAHCDYDYYAPAIPPKRVIATQKKNRRDQYIPPVAVATPIDMEPAQEGAPTAPMNELAEDTSEPLAIEYAVVRQREPISPFWPIMGILGIVALVVYYQVLIPAFPTLRFGYKDPPIAVSKLLANSVKQDGHIVNVVGYIKFDKKRKSLLSDSTPGTELTGVYLVPEMQPRTDKKLMQLTGTYDAPNKTLHVTGGGPVRDSVATTHDSLTKR